MRHKKDPRINAGYMAIRQFLLLLFILSAFNGFQMVIFENFSARNMIETHTQLVINIMGGYVVVMAVIFLMILAFIRHTFWNRPMRIVSKAAQKIAKGDFSVRIPPARKDGKKDFVEVMYEDFNTMAEELASIETLKNDFIANVSHEIKTPLAVIQNYATALQSDALTAAERREYTQTIVESTQKLTNLVSNILKLNKLENQEILPEAKPYALDEQLRRCALAFEELWERKHIVFEANLDEITITQDESMLELVWNNLLANAVKFTNTGGGISIRLQTHGGADSALVSISDTGCGMGEATQKRIFDKFYQGDTSHANEGNGLGLALVKEILDRIGAAITVESALGRGSTFTVCLKRN